jgi:UDP-galactopyranose mutase
MGKNIKYLGGKMNDIIIVGSGFSGSILARKIAEELNEKVLVIEKRKHIGGNMYDELDEHGILVQRYGPHFLNTNKYSIIKYLSQYCELFQHNTKLLSFIDGRYVRLPFNFETVQQLVGAEQSEVLLNKLRSNFSGRDRVPILELVNHEDKDINSYGNLLFDKAYKTYTSKQWGIDVNAIDKYVLERVPMAMNYDERYLNKDFQYLPKNGFSYLFENLLYHKNIEIQLNTDALNYITFDENTSRIEYDGKEIKCLIFTGAIDELFGLKYGSLPYRSLEFKYEYYNNESILPSEIVSYPQALGYTRRTEYKKIMYDNSNARGSVVATEYPLEYNINAKDGNIPYYPVNTKVSDDLYNRYLVETQKYSNLFLCGRLAEFKYYNMDVCIEHALDYFDNIKKYLQN